MKVVAHDMVDGTTRVQLAEADSFQITGRDLRDPDDEVIARLVDGAWLADEGTFLDIVFEP